MTLGMKEQQPKTPVIARQQTLKFTPPSNPQQQLDVRKIQSTLTTTLRTAGMTHPASSCSDDFTPQRRDPSDPHHQSQPPLDTFDEEYDYDCEDEYESKQQTKDKSSIAGAAEGNGALAVSSNRKSNKINSTADHTTYPRYTGCRNDKAKPPYSYASLIAQALLASSTRKLTLSAIYQWIQETYPYYRSENCGWQNSIRHNLSLNKCFIRLPQSPGDTAKDDASPQGKGAFWTIDESLMEDFEDGMFKRRKYGQGRASRRTSGSSTSSSNTQREKALDTLPSPIPIKRNHPIKMDLTYSAQFEVDRRKRKKVNLEDELFHHWPLFDNIEGAARGSKSMIENDEEEEDMEDDMFIPRQSHEDDPFFDNSPPWFLVNDMYAAGKPSHDTPPATAARDNDVLFRNAFTCPELCDAAWIFPLPAAFSDFYGPSMS